MGSKRMSFDAGVVTAVGVVLGVAYLLGAMFALLSGGGNSVLLLANSVPVTTTTGVFLLLMAGLLGTGHRNGRYVGILAFGAVVAFGRPTMAAPEPFAVLQAGLGVAFAVYLLLRNPVPARDRSNVDESTSATKVGSTIR